MKIAAVICEYNPFHNGHLRQLKAARAQLGWDAAVGLMSGNFVQRGEPALFPKELRARAALAGGLDLVLELPAVLTLQSAERYARNAVLTLNALGCVDTLFFGAECPDTQLLLGIAEALAAEEGPFRQRLREGLAAGRSFAAARAAAVQYVIGPAAAQILTVPNNILAVEYCKALLRSKSRIQPCALPRIGPAHHEPAPQGELASASAIRALLRQGADVSAYLPPSSQALLAGARPFDPDAMDRTLLANLCLLSPESLRQVADVAEGLEFALKREAATAQSLAALLEAVKSKRYAYSRIRRIVLNAYLGVTKEDTLRQPSYIRVLDFNDQGRAVLNLARKTAALPLVKHGGQVKNHPDALALYQRELALNRVYQLFYGVQQP